MPQRMMSDEQLMNLMRLSRIQLESAVQTWKMGMKVLQVDSFEYIAICEAGKKAQHLHAMLYELAFERGVSEELRNEVFSPTQYSFD
ncbi:MAG: hypothetical protein WCA35_23690 [Kovacikia sp.]